MKRVAPVADPLANASFWFTMTLRSDHQSGPESPYLDPEASRDTIA